MGSTGWTVRNSRLPGRKNGASKSRAMTKPQVCHDAKAAWCGHYFPLPCRVSACPQGIGPRKLLITPPPIASSIAALRTHVAAWRKAGLRVALVPTMGTLHDGHLSLVQQAQKAADRVIASIFVNPMQFGQNEDFGRYPRAEQADHEKLASVACDLLYAPS